MSKFICQECGKQVESWNEFHDIVSCEKYLKERVSTLEAQLSLGVAAIGAVMACCTSNSEEEAKASPYGLNYNSFKRIDEFLRSLPECPLDFPVLPNPPEEKEA